MRSAPLLALLALIAACARPPRQAEKSAPPGGLVVVVAHQDDDLLFMNPDLLARIRSGGVVLTVDVTAGDAGLLRWDDGFLSLAPKGVLRHHWQLREEGIRAAYATMARVPDVWTTADLALGRKRVALATLRDAPNVRIAFFRLPDGNIDGMGFEATGRASLTRLASGAIAELRPVDGAGDGVSTGWTRDDVVLALGAAMRASSTDEIWTLDATAARLLMYRGYGIAAEPVNLSRAEHAAKQEVFMTYAPYDMRKYPRPGPDGRADAERCDRDMGWDYAKWEWRRYRVAPRGCRPRGADAPCCGTTAAPVVRTPQ